MFSFRNLFKQDRREALKIDIAEVPSFLESKEIRNKQKAFLEKMKSDFSSLKNHLNSLASKNSSNNYSNILKNKFCSRSLSIIESLDDSIVAYKEAINEIGSIGVKEFRHLHAFSDDMKLIAAAINSIAKQAEDAEQTLESNPVFRKSRETENKFRQIESLIQKNSLLVREIDHLQKETDEKERSLKRKNAEFESFLTRSEFKYVETLDEEMKYVEKNKNSIRQKIVEEFAGIDRPMRKFRHSKIFESMIKEHRDSLSAYIESGEALFADDGFNIKKILELMKRAADEKQLDIEEKKYKRVVDILRHTSLLESLRGQYLTLLKKGGRLKEEKEKYNGLSTEKRNHKIELAELEKAIQSLKTELEEKIKEKKDTESEIVAGKEELESMLNSILGRKVVIS